MLLAVVACPRKSSNEVRFNERIVMCPIVDTKAAHLSSKHLPRGSMVLALATVAGERYKNLMIEYVTLAIKACMPRLKGHTIFVQDRGKPHTKGGIMGAIKEAAEDDIVMETQPDNLPDLSVKHLFLSFHPATEGRRGDDQHREWWRPQ
ncbi:unnamed protein product [Choristocarpus tenellus]